MIITKAFLHRTVVFIFLIGTVLIDLINGYYNFENPIGSIFRAFVIAFTFIYFISYNKANLYRLYVLIMLLLAVICNVSAVTYGNIYSPSMEASWFFKILYLPLLAFYLKYTIDKGYITFETLINWVVINVVLRAACIVFSTITGIGYATYGTDETDYGFGTTFYFNNQNDNSLAMLVGYCLCMYQQFSKKETARLWKVIIVLLGLALIGTRAGLLGGIGITFIATAHMVIFGKNSDFMNFGRKLAYSGVIISAILISSIFVYNIIKDKPFMADKYADLLTEQPRSEQDIAAEKFFESRDFIPQFFGSGVMQYRVKLYGNLASDKDEGENGGKQAEKDFVDLLGAYGYVQDCWIFLFPFLCLFILFKDFLDKPSSYLRFTLFIATAIFITHSLAAGHGIKNPTPTTILAVVYVYVLNRKQIKNEYT